MDVDFFAERNSLVERYREYTHAIASQLLKSMNLPVVMYEELCSAGYIGLIEAAGRYDSSTGVPFKNYAYLRIRGSIVDSIRAHSDIPPGAYRMIKILSAIDDMRAEYDFKERSQKSLRDNNIVNNCADFLTKSIVAFKCGNVRHDTCIENFESNTPEEILTLKQNLKFLKKLMNQLTADEKLIIEQYYFNNLSFTEISRSTDNRLTKSWISRLHSRAIVKLRDLYLSEERAVDGMNKKNKAKCKIQNNETI